MALSHLKIENLRNLSQIDIEPSTGINILLGENGSGKTSLLEAIYLLGLGRSFRTRTIKHALQYEQGRFQVFALSGQNNIPMGLRYDKNTGLEIRLNNYPLKRLSELANHLPIQLIPANCHQFFEQGPRFRRQLLDWSLFHVERGFHLQWQNYKRALQQRNAALRNHQIEEQVSSWNKHLAEYGEAIHLQRTACLEVFLKDFISIFPRLCPEYENADYSIQYQSGWMKNEKLADCLDANFQRDSALGYTRSGSHAADWLIKINNLLPGENLSRGQQKLYFIALSICQALQLKRAGTNPSIFLVDDLSSELDLFHQKSVLTLLTELEQQAFITSTDFSLASELDEQQNICWFHVKLGEIIQK